MSMVLCSQPRDSESLNDGCWPMVPGTSHDFIFNDVVILENIPNPSTSHEGDDEEDGHIRHASISLAPQLLHGCSLLRALLFDGTFSICYPSVPLQ